MELLGQIRKLSHLSYPARGLGEISMATFELPCTGSLQGNLNVMSSYLPLHTLETSPEKVFFAGFYRGSPLKS